MQPRLVLPSTHTGTHRLHLSRHSGKLPILCIWLHIHLGQELVGDVQQGRSCRMLAGLQRRHAGQVVQGVRGDEQAPGRRTVLAQTSPSQPQHHWRLLGVLLGLHL